MKVLKHSLLEAMMLTLKSKPPLTWDLSPFTRDGPVQVNQ